MKKRELERGTPGQSLHEVYFGKWKTLSDAATHQHIHIEDPAVFSCADTEALQVHAVFVVEDFVESVA